MKSRENFYAIGLMSGTSLDGLDLACVELSVARGRWQYRWIKATTLRYTAAWKQQLATAHLLSGEELIHLHTRYGAFLGQQVRNFVKRNRLSAPDFVASHGHTIFHQPERRFTFQLGDGNALHAACGYPVVCDFRSLDVALGGEGAPLVPIGDQHLFAGYDICLNLGGIANLSQQVNGQRKAFDICFCNMALNHLAAEAGLGYDRNGKLAASGTVNAALLKALTQRYARWRSRRLSLGREGFELEILPLLNDTTIPLQDRLRTVCESSAMEIAQSIQKSKQSRRMLATGGGALNSFFIQLLQEKVGPTLAVAVPDKMVINFKEALVFAFLGARRLRGEPNALRSVTGASHDSAGGLVIGR